jgi:protein-arginine kinase activator protein McsA
MFFSIVELEQLRDLAIKDEKYELAIKIRNKINHLKLQLQNNKQLPLPYKEHSVSND